MYNDKKLFFLGYGVLYITEMRRVRNLTRTSELRLKSKELTEIWYKLFKKYNLLPKKNKKIHVNNGIYTFGCSALSIYELLKEVKRLPEKEMDLSLRKRLKNITYSGKSPLNKNRIKILKKLTKGTFLTNELARAINFNPGQAFKNNLHILEESGYIKRKKIGKQRVRNHLTKKGRDFIIDFINNIENVPEESLYDEAFKNQQLASDLLLIISELEMGGIMQRAPYLQMKSKEFVSFILEICKRWEWTNQDKIKKREILGYEPVYSVYLNSKSVREIYLASGPCVDLNRNREFKSAILVRKPGVHGKIGETKEKILKSIENNINSSKELAFKLGVSIQNIQRPLSGLVEIGKLKREKVGGGYLYKIK